MVFKNKDVRSFNLFAFFSSHYVGNYIPLTMFFHALNWKLAGTNVGGHHLFNILIHLLNGVLAFRIGLILFKNKGPANVIAILFLLHPLQIESVGWISELKNVLWVFFAFLSIHAYLNPIESSSQSKYLKVFLFFLLACLSKPSAVILPLLFIALDIFQNNDFKLKYVLHKIPFLIIAIIFGIINMKTQSADLFINYSHAFPYYQRFAFGGFALLKYIGFFTFPIGLSALHPYPEFNSFILISGITFFSAVIILLSYLFYKKSFKLFALISLPLINLILVLQFIPFGESLYADRYMYMALFFFSLLPVYCIAQKERVLKYSSILLIIILPIISFSRMRIWSSAENLYTDVVKKYPESFVALNSLGTEKMMLNKDTEALQYLTEAVRVNEKNYKGYYNLGLVLLKLNKSDEAIKSFNQAIKLKENTKSYIGRASAYYNKMDIAKAISDAEYVLKSEPNNAKALFILANCYNEMNQLEKAISVYDLCIQGDADEPDFYFKRGIAYGKMQDFSKCKLDLDKCLILNKNYIEAYYWRGVVKVNLKENPCADLKIAAQNNYKPAVTAFQKYCQ